MEEQEYDCSNCGTDMDFVDAQFGNLCNSCREVEHEAMLKNTWHAQTLHELAQEYHTKTENYDEIWCTGISPRTGKAIPVTPEESRKINRHAIRVMQDIYTKGEKMGFTREEIKKTIQNFRD